MRRRVGRGLWRWGKGEIIYLSLCSHQQNDSCVKMSSDENHFNVFIDCEGQSHKIVSRYHFLKRRESRCGFEPRSLCLPALPLGQTDSQLRQVRARHVYCRQLWPKPPVSKRTYTAVLSAIRLPALLCLLAPALHTIRTLHTSSGRVILCIAGKGHPRAQARNRKSGAGYLFFLFSSYCKRHQQVSCCEYLVIYRESLCARRICVGVSGCLIHILRVRCRWNTEAAERGHTVILNDVHFMSEMSI